MCCLRVSACVAIVVHKVTQSMGCSALCVLHSETLSLDLTKSLKVICLTACNLPPCTCCVCIQVEWSGGYGSTSSGVL